MMMRMDAEKRRAAELLIEANGDAYKACRMLEEEKRRAAEASGYVMKTPVGDGGSSLRSWSTDGPPHEDCDEESGRSARAAVLGIVAESMGPGGPLAGILRTCLPVGATKSSAPGASPGPGLPLIQQGGGQDSDASVVE